MGANISEETLREESPQDSACSSSTTGTDSETTSDGASLWQALKCAKPSQLARKRKVKTNAPPVGAKRSQCHTSARSLAYTPRSVTPRQRVAEFPSEYLEASLMLQYNRDH